jgi:hypothetical protein
VTRQALGRRVELALGSVLAAYWARRDAPGHVQLPASLAISDNVQRPMNLVMPLRYPITGGRAEATRTLTRATDEILVGLNNVGTVHFARFTIVKGALCMFSVYDGDFEGYIRDFISSIGTSFDQIMDLVKNPPATPCAEHADEFIAWVGDHDALQLPDQATDLTSDISLIKRRILTLLHRNPNVQLGIYRAYPGFSAAQIRDGLGIGW